LRGMGLGWNETGPAQERGLGLLSNEKKEPGAPQLGGLGPSFRRPIRAEGGPGSGGAMPRTLANGMDEWPAGPHMGSKGPFD